MVWSAIVDWFTHTEPSETQEIRKTPPNRSESPTSSDAPAVERLQPGPNDLAEVRPGVFIGSAFAASTPETLVKHDITEVLTLTEEQLETTTHHTSLYDGPNDQQTFDEVVETARELFVDSRVIVHCAAGVSRSSAVTATALAAEEGLSFSQSLETLREHRPQVDPHPKLREQSRRYLGEAE